MSRSLSLSQLESITRSPAFQALPHQSAQEALAEGKAWWQAMDCAQETAAQMLVWEAAQHMAMLFDTYGDLVDSVSLDLTPEVQRDEVYVNTLLQVNLENCREDQWDLPGEDLEAMDEIDGSAAMRAAVKCLDDLPAQSVLPHLGLVQGAFSEPVRSAAQARDIADRHTGRIGPVLLALGLDKALKKAPRKRSGGARM